MTHHELRESAELTGMDGNPSRAELLAMASDVRDAVAHMQRVLDGLLLLARSQAGGSNARLTMLAHKLSFV